MVRKKGITITISTQGITIKVSTIKEMIVNGVKTKKIWREEQQRLGEDLTVNQLELH